LARDNGWPREFTRRVVEEYKRFMFLTTVADHVVSPSEAVDQAWHLPRTALAEALRDRDIRKCVELRDAHNAKMQTRYPTHVWMMDILA
jgi:hypothetical protein